MMPDILIDKKISTGRLRRGHGGRVVTLSPPTSEVGVLFLAQPQVGKLVVACHWSTVYSTEPDQLYVLVSSALPTTRRDMTCSVESDVKPQINK